MRRFTVVLLAACLGVVTLSTATAVVCGHSDAYSKFKTKYWGPHKRLDHRPTAATLERWRAWREHGLAAFDLACGSIIPYSVEPVMLPQPVVFELTQTQELLPQETSVMIAPLQAQVLSLYAVTVPSTSAAEPYGYNPGWYGGGGYAGGGKKPSTPACKTGDVNCPDGGEGGTKPPPVTGLVPELSSFVLVGTGLFSLFLFRVKQHWNRILRRWRAWRRLAQWQEIKAWRWQRAGMVSSMDLNWRAERDL